MAGPTDLQASIAARILSHARQMSWPVGHHLTEGSLEPILGTSRSPIRAAMALLEADGILERRPNRGYFIRNLPAALTNGPAHGAEPGDGERVYLAIAMDRLDRRLPDVVSENELMRRYDLTRAQLRLVLTRIAAEGWGQPSARERLGLSLSLIDTLEAYRENYRFRQMLEPACVLSPEFRIDAAAIERLRMQQVAIRDQGYRSLGQVELYAINADFHEAIAAMGGNRFVIQALARVNHARRLMEYARPLDRARVRRVCEEHLSILDSLAAGDRDEAARRLTTHLSDAADEKTARSAAPNA